MDVEKLKMLIVEILSGIVAGLILLGITYKVVNREQSSNQQANNTQPESTLKNTSGSNIANAEQQH